MPSLRGVIERRLLVNFSVDADAAASFLPAPFEAQLVDGQAIAGVCLIRLADIRPRFVPARLGLTMENAAQRFAVTRAGTDEHGVYIPRRDSSSPLVVALGGRAFPGVHQRARFSVDVAGDHHAAAFRRLDGSAAVDVAGDVTDHLPTTSVFESVDASSRFFEKDSIGWSATRQSGCYDGLQLRTDQWSVAPFEVEFVRSSFFDDEPVIPRGSVRFDHALIVRRVEHTWHTIDRVHAVAGG